VLYGSISLVAAGTAAWSLNDTSVVIGSRSLSPVTYTLPIGVTQVTLTLGTYSLTAGSTLAFYLTSTSGNFTSFASVIVTVNAPPSPGMFTVSPLSGQELTDQFILSAQLWSDPDLPLQYAFGYKSSSADLIMQPLKRTAYTSTILPAGQDISGYNVSCQVKVYDSYLAFSSAAFTVTVHNVVIKASALLSLGEYSSNLHSLNHTHTLFRSPSVHYPTNQTHISNL
jgi:REJ domain